MTKRSRYVSFVFFPPLRGSAYVSRARQSARPMGAEGDEGEGKQTRRRNVFFMLRLRRSIGAANALGHFCFFFISSFALCCLCLVCA